MLQKLMVYNLFTYFILAFLKDQVLQIFGTPYSYVLPNLGKVFFAMSQGQINCCTVTESENMLPRHLSPEVAAALQSVRFIAQHIKDADKDNEVSDSF